MNLFNKIELYQTDKNSSPMVCFVFKHTNIKNLLHKGYFKDIEDNKNKILVKNFKSFISCLKRTEINPISKSFMIKKYSPLHLGGEDISLDELAGIFALERKRLSSLTNDEVIDFFLQIKEIQDEKENINQMKEDENC